VDASQRARALRLAQALKNRQECEDDAADLLYELLAEREACAELMERQHTWITNVAAANLIRARGAA